MSSSATGATSTTASSTSSASNPAAAQPDGCGNGPVIGGPLPQPSPGKAAGTVEVVACGALAGHIREIAARRGWPVMVRPLSAALHNRPQNIKSQAERELLTAQAINSRAVLAYADCGTYGALDDLATEAGVSRLPGLHCYDLYAGAAADRATLRGRARHLPANRLLDQVFRESSNPALGPGPPPGTVDGLLRPLHPPRLARSESNDRARRSSHPDRRQVQPAADPYRHRHQAARRSLGLPD